MKTLGIVFVIVVVGITACGEDPVPAVTSTTGAGPDAESVAVSTPTQAPTRTPEATTESLGTVFPDPTPEQVRTPPTATPPPVPPPPGPPPPVADLPVVIDGDTRWRDLHDTLLRHEQDCIRHSLGVGLLPVVMDEPVSLNAFERTQEWQVLVFSCLDPETGRAILLFDLMSGFFLDGLPSAAEMDCLMGVAADTNPEAVISSLLPDSTNPVPMGEFWAGFVRCIPDRFIVEGLGFGDKSEILDDEATECLQNAIASLDGEAIMSALEDGNGSTSGSYGPFGGLENCLVHLWSDSSVEREEDLEDDHSDQLEGATPLNIGESAPGSVDYEADHDLFMMETREGETYRFEVAPGTLEDPGLTLFNAEFLALADSGSPEGRVPRLAWQAPVSGRFYIAVWGWGLGTYSLTVKVAESGWTDDDHSNTKGGATILTVGQDLPGNLDYGTDADIFRLDASEGTIYEVVAVLERLEYLELELRDAQWRYLESGYSHDETGAVGFSWRAPSSGDYYVVVRGFEAGSYILSSGAIEDDNRDSSEEATPIEVGVLVQGSIYDEDDVDYFVFQSAQGNIYRMAVELGTLKDSALTLYNRGGEVAFNEDFGDSYASRILWEAPDSDTYWLSVSGFQSGTYTLSITKFTLAK